MCGVLPPLERSRMVNRGRYEHGHSSVLSSQRAHADMACVVLPTCKGSKPIPIYTCSTLSRPNKLKWPKGFLGWSKGYTGTPKGSLVWYRPSQNTGWLVQYILLSDTSHASFNSRGWISDVCRPIVTFSFVEKLQLFYYGYSLRAAGNPLTPQLVDPTTSVTWQSSNRGGCIPIMLRAFKPIFITNGQ